MQRNLLIIAAVVLTALLVVGFIIFPPSDNTKDSSTNSQVPEGLIPVGNLPQTEWLRKITVEPIPSENAQIIKNEIDGYQIKVPNSWQLADDKAHRQEGVRIFYSKSDNSQVPAEGDVDILLILSKFISEEEMKGFFPQSIEFLEIRHPSGNASRAEYQLTKEGGTVIAYIFRENSSFYTGKCIIEGERSEKLISMCDAQMETFNFLQ